jgi:hypothetical protein
MGAMQQHKEIISRLLIFLHDNNKDTISVLIAKIKAR